MHCLSSLQCPLPTALYWALHLPVLRLPSVLLKIHGPYCCGKTNAAWLGQVQVGQNVFKDKKRNCRSAVLIKARRLASLKPFQSSVNVRKCDHFSWFNPKAAAEAAGPSRLLMLGLDILPDQLSPFVDEVNATLIPVMFLWMLWCCGWATAAKHVPCPG